MCGLHVSGLTAQVAQGSGFEGWCWGSHHLCTYFLCFCQAQTRKRAQGDLPKSWGVGTRGPRFLSLDKAERGFRWGLAALELTVGTSRLRSSPVCVSSSLYCPATFAGVHLAPVAYFGMGRPLSPPWILTGSFIFIFLCFSS